MTMKRKNIKLDTTFHIHEDLKKTLRDMEKHCPVAKKLLSIKSTSELPRYINYLGISQDNNSFISYLDDKRASVCIEKYNKPKELKDLTIGDKVKLNKDGANSLKMFFEMHEISAKVDGRSSFTIIDTDSSEFKLQVTENHRRWFNILRLRPIGKMVDFYVPAIRYHTSCVKIVKKLFANQFTEQEYSNFCSMFKIYHPTSNILDRYTKDFVTGDAILDWYHKDKYESEKGSLGNSCMRYGKCRPWLQIYADNPETIQLFIIKNEDDLLVGRCLIWGGKYFDRVYGVDNDIEVGAITHLKDLGYVDVYNGFDDTVTFKLNKSYQDYEYFPYMDTFACISGKEIWNSANSDDADKILRNADGRWDGYEEEDNEVICEVDSNYYPESECVYFEHLNGWVHSDNTTWCEWINQSWPDNDVTKLYDGTYAPDSQITELFNGTYAHEDDDYLTCDVDGDYFILGKHDFVEVEDKWYSEDDDRICYTNASKYMLKEKCVEIEGEWYDKDDCFFSKSHGWTLEEVVEDGESETENPLQLKLFECELTENYS